MLSQYNVSAYPGYISVQSDTKSGKLIIHTLDLRHGHKYEKILTILAI
ncbi:hypothetical protein H5185_09100 [Shewanella sp. SG44-6]|nr:hypothetical protein [Shewanella sp. SG44-6]MBB1389580.1 hypothetical protein [Shewanella sp. SG44-6]